MDLNIFIMQLLLSLFITQVTIARATPVPQESALDEGYTTSDPSSGDLNLLENTGVSSLPLDGSNIIANSPFATPNYPNPYTEDHQVVPQLLGGSETEANSNGLYDIIEALADPEPPKCDGDHTHQLCCDDGLSSASRDRTRCENFSDSDVCKKNSNVACCIRFLTAEELKQTAPIDLAYMKYTEDQGSLGKVCQEAPNYPN